MTTHAADAGLQLASLSTTLLPLQFWLGYAAIVALPGPNCFLIATVTAVGGFRRALPLMLSIGLGSATLAMGLSVLFAASIDHTALGAWLPIITTLLLLAAAWRIATLQPPSHDEGLARHSCSKGDCLLGFACGLINPITSSYFASQLLGQTGSVTARSVLMTGSGVFAVSLICTCTVAAVLSAAAVRKAVERHLPPIKHALAGFFCVMAALSLYAFK